MFAKRDYYSSVFNKYSANLKMTWQTINETLNRRKKKTEYPQEFKLSNGKKNPRQIAEVFNNYFISICSAQTSKLRRKIKNTLATYATN